MKNKVLLSTDIGSDIDDALALLTILNSGINLQGINTVNGDVASRAYIAKHMINLSGKNVSVSIGESKSLENLAKPYSYFEDCYVHNSFFKDADFTEHRKPEEVGIIPDGVEDLAEKLSKETYTIFSIAPLTNIAKLIKNHPEVVKNIERLYMMGCRFPEGELEHNVKFDPVAANIVLESDIPITIVPGNLCQKYKMPTENIDNLNSKPGKYVKRMARSFIGLKIIEKLNNQNMIKDKTPSFCDVYTVLRDGLNLKEEAFSRLGFEKTRGVLDEKQALITNLNDFYFAAFSPNQYFKQYSDLIKHLKNNMKNYNSASLMRRVLKALPQKTLSIADVYIPYCFLHRDKLKIERGTVSVDADGRSYLSKKEKHEIVTGLDFKHFKKFIGKNLR